jgi:hypothetical protein
LLTIWFAAICLAVVAAGFVWLAYKATHRTSQLAVVVVGLALVIVGLGFATYPVAHNIAKASAVGGYQQTLNGSIVAADVSVASCRKVKEDAGGSNCKRTIRCDSYTDQETYTETDSKGKTVVKTRLVTKYYDCPVMSEEYTYTLTAVAYHSFSFVVADSIFGPGSRSLVDSTISLLTTAPDQLYRAQQVAASTPNAPPEQWLRAKAALEQGDSEPATVPDTYDNFILGSEQEDANDYSGDILELRNAGLLPDHTANLADPIHDLYRADKVSFVGVDPGNQAVWQDAVMRFNAAFGTLKQGDLHMVVLRASALPAGIAPEDYLRALKAHWQADLGKNAFPKNAVALVVAVDDQAKTIKWARATTGMPIGNNTLSVALQSRLLDAPFDPETLFGQTRAQVNQQGGDYQVSYTVGQGTIPRVAITEEHSAFKRACMSCDDDDEQGEVGFVSLKDLIPISGWGIFWAILSDLFIGLGLTALALYLHYLWTGNTPTFYPTNRSYRF